MTSSRVTEGLLDAASLCIKAQSKHKHLNAFTTRADGDTTIRRLTKLFQDPPKQRSDSADGSAWGRLYAVKDNICTEQFPTTAASGMLADWQSPYEATVVRLLRQAGGIVTGKTNMDEFGMGSHNLNSHWGPVVNKKFDDPDKSRMGEVEFSAGGSSGGSAIAVATGQCYAALGTDTGGSVRLPAAYSGVAGFKPSYGLLSRWGVIPYANSLDTVGIFTKNVADITDIFDKLNMYDPLDPTSVPPSTRTRLQNAQKTKKTKKILRIGIPRDYNIEELDPGVYDSWARTLSLLQKRGHTIHPVDLPTTRSALAAYYVIAGAEAASNLAKYDGVRYGSRAEGPDSTSDSVLFSQTRGQYFGAEVQRRILLGSFSLSAQAKDNYFLQAQRVRRLVSRDFDGVFASENPLVEGAGVPEWGGVDCLLCPTAPTRAPTQEAVRKQSPVETYMNDVFTVPASLAGLPACSVSVPIRSAHSDPELRELGVQEKVGMQVIGQYGSDQLVLELAAGVEEACDVEEFDKADS